ncbi:MAG: hypothetical protein JST27_04860 [Bacteroidetes bacterium]|nr:hypothetical protein [Bacteroidota bacterium]
MKNHFWQPIRIRINSAGASIRFNIDSDKSFKRVKGIWVSYPQGAAETGSTLGLSCNNKEVFKDDHPVKMLTCGPNVRPNQRFFEFEEVVDAGGSIINGRYTDGAINPYLTANGQAISGVLGVNDFMPATPNAAQAANPNQVVYPHDVLILLWLTNDELTAHPVR